MLNTPLRYSSKRLQGDELILAQLDSYRQLQHIKKSRRLTMGERGREAELQNTLRKKKLID